MKFRSKSELKELISFRAVLWMAGCVGVLLLLSAVFQNLALVKAVVLGAWSLGGSFGVLVGLVRFDAFLMMTGILMGANIFLRKKTAVCGIVGVGASCASCGLGIASFLGLALLPFGGREVGVVAILVLVLFLVKK